MTELERPGLRTEKSMVVKRSCNTGRSVAEEKLGVYMGQQSGSPFLTHFWKRGLGGESPTKFTFSS